MEYIIYIAIGLVAGFCSGFFGIGGGMVIVPMLIYFMHFTPQKAIGTSLAIMLPPMGLLGVLHYYKSGAVSGRAALFVGVFMFVATYLGASASTSLRPEVLRFIFGCFLILLGLYILIDSYRKL